MREEWNGLPLVVEPPTIEDVAVRWSAERKIICEVAVSIINQYQAQGIPLGVRQVCYILEARSVITKTSSNFSKVGRWLGDLRKLGVIPFDTFQDLTRRTAINSELYSDPEERYNSIRDFLMDYDQRYKIPLWWKQPFHVEVWCEAKGVAATLGKICQGLEVNVKPLGGQDSITESWGAIKRLQELELGKGTIGDGIEKKIVVLYVGDHDPSGIQIEKTAKGNLEANGWIIKVEERLAYANQVVDLHSFERIAVTMRQVSELGLSANPTPANPKDTNTKAYIEHFGTSNTWEADAIEPTILGQIVKKEILKWWDGTAELDRDIDLECKRMEIRTLMERDGITNWERGEDQDDD